jgi:hypothetical protein
MSGIPGITKALTRGRTLAVGYVWLTTAFAVLLGLSATSLAQEVGNSPAPVAAPAAPSFGPFDGLVDRQMVFPDGLTLDIKLAEGGNALILQSGKANGEFVSQAWLRPSGPGSYSVDWVPARSHRHVALLRPDGVLTVISDFEGWTTAWWREGDRLGQHVGQMLGQTLVSRSAPRYLEFSNADRLNAARANMEGSRLAAEAEAQQAREAKWEAEERQSAMFNNVLGALTQADTSAYAQAQANLDATVANIQAAAAVERQQQTQTHATQAQRRSVEQAATVERQRLQAVALAESPQVAARPAATAQPAANPASQILAGTGQKAPGGTMTFILLAPLDTVINRMNGTCYSNLVSIPGPPGWPVLDHTNDRAAAELVQAYIPGFEAQCSQAGPVRSSSYIWNARSSEGRPGEELARQMRNQMFQVQVSP